MFDRRSRYYGIETKLLTLPDGREIPYIKRRFIPQTQGTTLPVTTHTVQSHERLDYITFQYLGDPTLFWHVCDLNGALVPEELEETGRVLHIQALSL